MSGIDGIMQDSDYDDATIYGRRPIHSLCRHGRSNREEGEDVSDDNVRPSEKVEGHAISSCGPASGQQGFSAEALVEDAADAHQVWLVVSRCQEGGCQCVRCWVVGGLQLESRLTTPMLMMALNATVEPRLIKLSRAVMHIETKIEFRGMSQPGRTYDRKSAAGSPLSRAKANIWRDAVATLLMAEHSVRSVMMQVITVAPALDPVAL